MSGDYKLNWPLPDEFLIEIGRLSALWASLEVSLNFAIGKLAGYDDISDPVPFILTVHASFPQRLDILATLCEQRLHAYPHLREYKGVVSKVKNGQNLRNRFIHNIVNYDSGRKEFHLALGSARQTLKTAVVKITVKEIHDACKVIHTANLDLHELITKVKYSPVWDR